MGLHSRACFNGGEIMGIRIMVNGEISVRGDCQWVNGLYVTGGEIMGVCVIINGLRGHI